MDVSSFSMNSIGTANTVARQLVILATSIIANLYFLSSHKMWISQILSGFWLRLAKINKKSTPISEELSRRI
jgi:hypothetical protein